MTSREKRKRCKGGFEVVEALRAIIGTISGPRRS